jgi:N-acetyltransferase
MDSFSNIPKSSEVKDIRGMSATLRRMVLADTDALWQAASTHAHDIFRWYTHPIDTYDRMRNWVEKALEEESVGSSITFVTVLNPSGEIAGGTRFMEIDRANRKLQIGNTWLVPQFQRTGINVEAKYLMLKVAFEEWGVRRLELRTDSKNDRSRAAILGIGAKEEGTLRNHMVRHDDSARHSVYYSVIAEEWPEVKARLEQRLAQDKAASHV